MAKPDKDSDNGEGIGGFMRKAFNSLRRFTSQFRQTRLDRALAAALPALTRSRVKALIEGRRVALAEGQTIEEPSRKVKTGERFEVDIPEPEPAEPVAQALALDIHYEDGDLLVLNKPAGMVVHTAPGNPDSTLVNALLGHCQLGPLEVPSGSVPGGGLLSSSGNSSSNSSSYGSGLFGAGGLLGWAMGGSSAAVSAADHHKRYGVWVPACAGTTHSGLAAAKTNNLSLSLHSFPPSASDN